MRQVYESLYYCYVFIYREKNRDLKLAYDRLERMALSGPKSKEFEEPKVQGLWRVAQKADFTSDELESLRVRKACAAYCCDLSNLL